MGEDIRWKCKKIEKEMKKKEQKENILEKKTSLQQAAGAGRGN